MRHPEGKLREPAVRAALCFIILIASCAFSLSKIKAAARKPVPTFAKDVAPILFKNCVKCHQTGELASRIPLTSFEAVRASADLIKQKVIARDMPPWPADPATGLKFRNDPRLSQRDIDTVVAWVSAGAPKGHDAELPPVPQSDDGWMHPHGLKPDLVIPLPSDVHLPAAGALPYVRILVKVPFSDDRWVTASQTRPGNPAVVHHMALTEIELPDGMSPSELDRLATVARQIGLTENALMNLKPAVTTPSKSGRPDMLAIYTPGSTLEMYSEGSAKLLRGGKNMYLDFNIHYETTGKSETDRSRIALWFGAGTPGHQLFRVNGAAETIIANGKELLTDTPGIKAEGTNVAIPPIPPFAENYELIGMTAYAEPVTIYQFQPHAHHRGKDFKYSVVYPDGREEPLLSVPKYDHRWQMAYELETPLKLPAGSKLVVTAHYDNSTMNMHNPAPGKPVYFRDQNQSWDEMFTPFIQYSMDLENPRKPPMASPEPQHEVQPADGSGGRNEAKSKLEIGEVVGCLRPSPSGQWLVTHASQATISDTQATSSLALNVARARPLGTEKYQLLGVRFFNPSQHRAERVAVKGVLIQDAAGRIRLNVTSLQTLATSCAK